MKKICIYLMKVHRFYYLLLGALTCAIVFGKVENVQGMIPFSNMNPLIPLFFIFAIGYIQVFAMAMFYTEEERITKEINGDIGTLGGFVLWDNYFPIKTNTELSLFKRLCGYVYVIINCLIHLASGYMLAFLVLFSLSYK